MCFNSNTEMQVNHLQEGGMGICARCSTDAMGRKKLRMRTRGNTTPANSPLGSGESFQQRGRLLRTLPQALERQGCPGGWWVGVRAGPLSRGLFFHPKAIVCL